MNNPISSEYMVRVECMTYNHAPYIEDAMNGFCMQETDFPFVCVIVDDASTDGEQEVIKNYLKNHFDLQNDQFFREEDTDDYHLIFARHKTNLNCYFGVLLLKYNHWGKKDKTPYYESWSKAKYIALCEGDDYWIHPKKLLIQVDLLEKDTAIGLCYTACRHFNQESERLSESIFSNIGGYCDFSYLLLREPATTLTTMFRVTIEEEYINEINSGNKKWLMGDTPRLLWYAVNSKIYNINTVTATYRELPESASHTRDIHKMIKFHKSTRDIRLYFCELYPKHGKELKKDVWNVYYQSCLIDSFKSQKILYIIRYLLLSHTTNIAYYVWLKTIIWHKIKRTLL